MREKPPKKKKKKKRRAEGGYKSQAASHPSFTLSALHLEKRDNSSRISRTQQFSTRRSQCAASAPRPDVQQANGVNSQPDRPSCQGGGGSPPPPTRCVAIFARSQEDARRPMVSGRSKAKEMQLNREPTTPRWPATAFGARARPQQTATLIQPMAGRSPNSKQTPLVKKAPVSAFPPGSPPLGRRMSIESNEHCQKPRFENTPKSERRASGGRVPSQQGPAHDGGELVDLPCRKPCSQEAMKALQQAENSGSANWPIM